MSPSLSPEGQRQFKLSSGFKEWFKGEGGNNWKLQKNKFQGIKIERIGGLFGTGNEKSVYKLVLKNEWTSDGKVDFDGKGVRGALGLFKAKLTGKDKWEVEEVTINENQKVWLIMAQGDKAIYLMPVMRASGWWIARECSGSGSNKKENSAAKEVDKKGIANTKEWSNKFDWKKEWDTQQDDEIKKLMESGFSITRKNETTVWGGSGSGYRWSGIGGMKSVRKESLQGTEKKQVNEIRKIGEIYKNAGELTVKSGWGDGSHYCWKRERYFPLDLVVLGDSEETVEPEVTNSGKEQTIKITDTISEVIGTRNYFFNQVDFYSLGRRRNIFNFS